MMAHLFRQLITSGDHLIRLYWCWKFHWGAKLWGADFMERRIGLAPERYLQRVLQCLGAEVAETAIIKRGLQLDNLAPEKGLVAVRIGAKAYLGPGVFIDLAEAVTIENEAVLAPQVMILTHGDVGDRMLARWMRRKEGPVVLKQGCWVGARAVILPGVTVGIGAVVGAGAVVTSDVSDFTVVAGVPARVLRHINSVR